jgi:outer membrane receptor protein involved in Fe transport
MSRKLLMAFTLLLVLPALLFAQEGKLRGRVTDSQSGEPLIGANVIIEGTTLGASTDINGEYVILSVPPGAYSVRASYIGYSAVTIANVRVSANLTTTQDFQLTSTAILTREIEVVAERPLIQRNTTNTIRIATQEDLQSLPFRGVSTYIALQAGVVERDGRLYVRGGRAGEVAYFVDGANVTNPFFNTQNVNVIQEVLEEVQLQSGGYTAEFGGAASGIVRTTVRTGGPELKWTLDYRTDDFAKPGNEFLGTTAFGYRNAVLTVGGPLTGGIRFFLTGQHNYTRQSQKMFLEPFKFEGLKTDNLGNLPAGIMLPRDGTIEFKRNYLYNNWELNNQAVGTLLFDLNQLVQQPLKVKLTGSYDYYRSPNGTSWPSALVNYFRDPSRLTHFERTTAFGNIRVTHILGPTTFYEVGLSYQNRFARNFDQDFGDDWKLYSDSTAFAAKGIPTRDWRNRYEGPFGYSTIFQFPSSAGFPHPYSVNNSYSKNNQSQVGATIDFTSQINPRWELKAGGSIDSWTIRSYSIASVSGYWVFLDPNRDGRIDRTFASEYERRVRLIRAGGISNYGYDYEGNKTDGISYDMGGGRSATLDGPRKPLFASAYIQNKFEYRDLILNIGARFEYFDAKILGVPTTVNPLTGMPDWQEPPIDQTLGVVEEDKLVESEAQTYLLPRLNFAFPVTDRTVFYAQYGKYAQLPSLNQLYIGNVTLSGIVNPSTRTPYNLGGAAAPFTAKPERNTSYEMGLRQTLTDNLALTLSGFYKDLKDQMQLRRIFNSAGIPLFVGFQNEDFGTVKGLETTLELRRTNRLAARVNYTLSDARGTGSTARSSQNAVTDEASARFPNFINPLDYNVTHKGTVMLDYRFGKGDGGPILEGMGLNAVLSFNSGHNYTKIKEPQNLGQASPWNIGVRALIDSRSRNPVEPINASTTPWVFNVDMGLSKTIFLDFANIVVYANVLNLFNTRQILNVYPTTGTPYDDGWLKSPFAEPYKAIPNYESFYRQVILNNRYAYMTIGPGGGLGQQAGGDLFGAPRQIIFGVKLEM